MDSSPERAPPKVGNVVPERVECPTVCRYRVIFKEAGYDLPQGAVARVVGIEGGVVSEVINLESSGVRAPRIGDHAMTGTITKIGSSQREAEPAPQLFDDWFDPIETEVRDRARGFIEELIRGELDAVLARPRYVRSRKADAEGAAGVTGHRHGSRRRSRGTAISIGPKVPVRSGSQLDKRTKAR